MDRRRERCGQPDAAVAIPRAVDFDGWKEEREGARGHHVIDAKRAADAFALRPLPGLDAAVVARLHPGHRLARRVARRGERDGPQPAGVAGSG